MTSVLKNRDLADVLPRSAVERLRSFGKATERALPGRVTGVVLFGSRARGDAKQGSDYDVAVFVRDLTSRRAINHLLSDVAYQHLLAGMHIVPVAVPDDFLSNESLSGLARSIERDGILVS